MQDKLIIATKTKKTIELIEKTIINFPHKERNLKNRLANTCYDLLENIYYANITKEINSMKKIIVNIKMIDYFLKLSCNRELISLKKYEQIGNYLLEINKMVNIWIKNETSKQNI